MKKTILYLLLALPLTFFLAACSDDDEEMKGGNTTVVINPDGTASGGHIFSAVDATNFYLDYIKYSVVEGHLVVSGYDKAGFKGAANIVSRITYNGNTYEVLGIENNAFSNCTSLSSVTFPNCVTSIKYGAFSGCINLTSVTLPKNMTSIEDLTFSGCKRLTSITIPNTVKYIGIEAFKDCTGLISITIPNSVTFINIYAFYGCSSLTSVHCKSTTPPESGDVRVFSSETYSSATLYVPKGSLSAYKSAIPWIIFKNIVEE